MPWVLSENAVFPVPLCGVALQSVLFAENADGSSFESRNILTACQSVPSASVQNGGDKV